MSKKVKGINFHKAKKKQKRVETHQQTGKGIPSLTTAQGVTVSDDQNSLKIGSKGPTLLEDFHFREKIFHFDHERIPERVVHAQQWLSTSSNCP